MKKQLEDELIAFLSSLIPNINGPELRLRIDMILAGYEVTKGKQELEIYKGDLNENMLKRFLAAKIAQGCSKRTITYYRNSIKMTFAIIGKPYSSITADDIRLYLAKRIYTDKVSKATANNERRNLSAFYGWLQKEEILLKNPMTKVDPIKATKKKKKAFEQMDLEKIRDKCRTKRETAIIEVLISTWARVTEVTLIRIDDIHDNRLTVHGKGDKDREVYLNPRAVLAVTNYLAERGDKNPYLFPKAKYAGDVAQLHKIAKDERCEWYKDPELVDPKEHTDQGTIESIVRSIGKKAGVPNTHPHRFRRTGATMALRAGMPLIQVSKLLGHENVGTTQIYLDISDEELEQAHKRYVN